MSLKFVMTLVAIAAALIGIGSMIAWRIAQTPEPTPRSSERSAIPVETSPIQHGPIQEIRVFSASLEARAQVTVASKVQGLVTSVRVDLSDQVERGTLIATLDDAEFLQSINQAQAGLNVARAEQVEASNALEIADREQQRTEELHAKGIAADTELDTTRAAQLEAASRLEVAKAGVDRAQSLLESARIRHSYTQIRANWDGGQQIRYVAQRLIEVGETVSANEPLMTIIELDPIEAVLTVTEREYAQLRVGQRVTLSTDAYPDRSWEGEIERIAPAFEEGSRQARVEVRIDNADGSLRPGMFARVRAVLDQADNAIIVPTSAVVTRKGQSVVFLVDDSLEQPLVRSVPIEAGITQGTKSQVLPIESGALSTGRVVSLGLQLLDDGSPVTLVDAPSGTSP